MRGDGRGESRGCRGRLRLTQTCGYDLRASITRVAHRGYRPSGSAPGTIVALRVSRSKGSARWALAVFGVLAVASVPLYLALARHEWFFLDEWDFLANRTAWNLGDLLRPHTDHWTTLPILAWRALWWTVGLRSYLPYVFLSVLAHVAVAALTRAVMRRAGVDPWIATIVAGVVLFFGAGAENIMYAFQITFTGALAFGLGQLLLADHDGPIDRRDWFGLCLRPARAAVLGRRGRDGRRRRHCDALAARLADRAVPRRAARRDLPAVVGPLRPFRDGPEQQPRRHTRLRAPQLHDGVRLTGTHHGRRRPDRRRARGRSGARMACGRRGSAPDPVLGAARAPGRRRCVLRRHRCGPCRRGEARRRSAVALPVRRGRAAGARDRGCGGFVVPSVAAGRRRRGRRVARGGARQHRRRVALRPARGTDHEAVACRAALDRTASAREPCARRSATRPVRRAVGHDRLAASGRGVRSCPRARARPRCRTAREQPAPVVADAGRDAEGTGLRGADGPGRPPDRAGRPVAHRQRRRARAAARGVGACGNPADVRQRAARARDRRITSWLRSPGRCTCASRRPRASPPTSADDGAPRGCGAIHPVRADPCRGRPFPWTRSDRRATRP